MPSQTVLITGATDGIGLELARLYQQRGARLILVGRHPLSDLADPLFTSEVYCRTDLSQPDAAAVIIRWLKAHNLDTLDVLVNNASAGYHGPVEEESKDNVRTLVAVNLRAPIALTYALLPHLRRANGQVVFISSVVTAIPSPDHAVYGATKAAIDGFVRNLRIELEDTDVTVQVIHPGGSHTGAHAKAGVPEGQIERLSMASPEDVARDILTAIDTGEPAAAIGIGNRMLRAAGRYLAGVVDAAMRIGRRLR